jgi:hypothetical protein
MPQFDRPTPPLLLANIRPSLRIRWVEARARKLDRGKGVVRCDESEEQEEV